MSTKIGWTHRPGTTGETWNVVTGCTPISAGCANCYAEAMCRRFWQVWDREPPPNHFKVMLHEDRLEQPLRWKKPRTVFVCSMSDLFHEDVPTSFIGDVINTIGPSRQHTFLVLTKRAQRMAHLMTNNAQPGGVLGQNGLKNLWLGVTAENQATANERIPLLLQTPAAVRFVSVEPMLEPMNLMTLTRPDGYYNALDGCGVGRRGVVGQSIPNIFGNKLDYVIVGAESGPSRRECRIEWVRDLVQQCQSAQVPVFVKQLQIDGRVSHDMDEWPEDLRVREWPK